MAKKEIETELLLKRYRTNAYQGAVPSCCHAQLFNMLKKLTMPKVSEAHEVEWI